MADLRPIKILYLHPTYAFGGAERTSRHLLHGLNPERFSVALVSSRDIASRISSQVVNRHIFIEELGMNTWFESIGTLCKDVKIAGNILKEERYDVAFGMMHYASVLLAIAKRTTRYKGRIIVSPRGPSTDYLNTCFSDSKVRFLLRMLFGFFCRHSDSIIVPSQGTKDDCVKNFGAKPERVRVINNSVDIETIAARGVEPLDIAMPEDMPVIASVGRLTSEKNFPLLLRAFSMVIRDRKARLLIIGDGAERRNLEELSKRLSIAGDVVFTGFQDNPYKYLKRSSLYVHTCLVEGFGNVIIEAMACGLPVIATDCPYGPREIIEHDNNGLLVPIDDAHALAKAIVRLLEDDHTRMAMAEAALKRAHYFSVEKMVRAYEKAFEELSVMSDSLSVNA